MSATIAQTSALMRWRRFHTVSRLRTLRSADGLRVLGATS